MTREEEIWLLDNAVAARPKRHARIDALNCMAAPAQTREAARTSAEVTQTDPSLSI